jgi:hypothetical protein
MDFPAITLSMGIAENIVRTVELGVKDMYAKDCILQYDDSLAERLRFRKD